MHIGKVPEGMRLKAGNEVQVVMVVVEVVLCVCVYVATTLRKSGNFLS